jgi:hypothetical protein
MYSKRKELQEKQKKGRTDSQPKTHTHIKKKKRERIVSKITFFSRKKTHAKKKHTVPCERRGDKE